MRRDPLLNLQNHLKARKEVKTVATNQPETEQEKLAKTTNNILGCVALAIVLPLTLAMLATVFIIILGAFSGQ